MKATRRPAASAILLVLSLTGCSDGPANAPADAETVTHPTVADAPSAQDGLTLTAGASYEMHEAVAVCQPSAEDDDTVLVRLSTPPDYLEHRKPRVAFFYVEAVPGTKGVYELPLDGGEDERQQAITVFSYHPKTRSEFSGNVETSTGTITILEASCDPEPRLAFTIRATLGAEAGRLPSVHVVGGLTAGQ